jgi:hypothetical protein
MQAVLEALPLLSVVLLPENQAAGDLIEELDPDERFVEPEIKDALIQLWQDPAVRAAIGERSWAEGAAAEKGADSWLGPQRSNPSFRSTTAPSVGRL